MKWFAIIYPNTGALTVSQAFGCKFSGTQKSARGDTDKVPLM